MRPHWILFLGFIATAGLLISFVISGGWFGDVDIETINAVSVFKSVQVGIWTLSVPNSAYFSSGLKAFTSFDYAFFGGSFGLFKWALIMTVGAATAWGIFTVIIVAASSLFSRR